MLASSLALPVAAPPNAAARPEPVRVSSARAPFARWVAVWALLALAAVQLALPALHRAAIGVPRLQAVTLAEVQARVGVPLSAEARGKLDAYVAADAPLAAGAVRAAVAVLGVLLAAAVVHAAALLADPAVPAGRVLDAVALAAAVPAVLRAASWAAVLLVAGPDGAAAMDWTDVARMDAGLAAPDGAGALLLTLLSAADAFVAVGAVTAAGVLTGAGQGLTWPRALLVAAVWPALLAVARLGLALAVHQPVR